MSTVRIEVMSFSSRTLLSHCTELIGLKVHCALKNTVFRTIVSSDTNVRKYTVIEKGKVLDRQIS